MVEEGRATCCGRGRRDPDSDGKYGLSLSLSTVISAGYGVRRSSRRPSGLLVSLLSWAMKTKRCRFDHCFPPSGQC